ncbi:MAG: VCBS repeat-containing protein, partial [Cyclobacteriaceae bacterium]
MGARMGRRFSQREAIHFQALREEDLSLPSAIITNEEWDLISAYYFSNSPDTLPYLETKISDDPLALFEPQLINVTGRTAAASLVKFDSTGFWYGDARANQLYFYDLLTKEISVFEVGGAPSDMLIGNNGFSVLTMGDIFPNDDREGQLLTFADRAHADTLLDNLSRPVKIKREDLNNDGKPDLIICGFGHLSGSLEWYENTDNGYSRHVLRAEPGAINAVVLDLNNDGYKDILALMTQGREGFFAYLGDGSGGFSEKMLYSFPPFYGSSYFELKDMNGDGKVDIIYANGDTGDYNYPALKPYHAVRILIQKQPLVFEEAFAFP